SISLSADRLGAESSRLVDDFRLLDHLGKSHELYRYADSKAIVVIGQGNGCPIIERSIPTIKTLRDRYSARGAEFFFINANAQDSRANVVKEASDFGVNIPILLDETQLV